MTPQKYPQNHHTPKKSFSENPKNIAIQNFEPPKNDPSLRMFSDPNNTGSEVCMKTSEYPPSPWGLVLLSPGSFNRL